MYNYRSSVEGCASTYCHRRCEMILKIEGVSEKQLGELMDFIRSPENQLRSDECGVNDFRLGTNSLIGQRTWARLLEAKNDSDSDDRVGYKVVIKAEEVVSVKVKPDIIGLLWLSRRRILALFESLGFFPEEDEIK